MTDSDVPVFPDWQHDPVYIVGGGTSLQHFEWEKLAGKKTIALNRAFEVLPDAPVLYWTDRSFYKWFKTGIDAFKGMRITCEPIESAIPEILVLNGVRQTGIDLRPGYICRSRNSACGAINLAVKFGAKRIYLLGIDLFELPEQSHWHEGYKKFSTRTFPSAYEVMQEDFWLLKPFLREFGIEVWNANPASKLKGYRKCTIAAALADVPTGG